MTITQLRAHKKNTKYRPEYCEMLEEHMKSGSSFPSFAGTIGVSGSAIDYWAKEFPAFGAIKFKYRKPKTRHYKAS